MPMKRLIILLCAAMGLIPSLANAQQLKKFTHEDAAFLREIATMYGGGDAKKAEKIMEKEIIPIWNSGAFGGGQKERIWTMCDKMLEKRKAPVDFENYMNTLMSLVKNERTAAFEPFHNGLDKVLSSTTRKQFSIYLETCLNIFNDYTLFDSKSVKWVAQTPDYRIEFDSVPYFVFKKVDLKAISKGDSSVIWGTEGIYYPTRNQWVGKGGRVDWTRAGMNPGKVYAELRHYKVDVTRPQFNADSVTFQNPEFLSKPQLGSLMDKVLADVKEDNASYPRFDSYDVSIVIPNVYPDIDYEGGFSQHGVKFMGTGRKGKEATLVFKKLNRLTKVKEPFIRATSKAFVIKKDKIVSDRARMAMYYEGDSIWHPGLQINYQVDGGKVAFTRDRESVGMSPFYDSYHHMDLHVESISWKMGEEVMEMRNITGGGDSEVTFESENFYEERRFDRMQGTGDNHPLKRIRDYAKQRGTDVIPVQDMAGYLKADESDVKIMLINMANAGLMHYNFDNNTVTIKQRLVDYVLNKSKQKDYDAIQYSSTIKNVPNAKLNLLNWDMDMDGVSRVFLSDSQQVVIYPREQHLTVKKNRDFHFDGRVLAGQLDMYGKNFDFRYDAFKVDMEKIDSLRMKVPDGVPDESGRQPMKKVKTLLRDLKGEVLVDRPDNKSSLKGTPRYPVFNSLERSFVYYDGRDIQDGAYKKETFYFHLQPFTIDSAENFTKEGIAFEGDFISAGIFPEFKETLKLQPDFSLGFVRKTPEGGFPVFGGKGQYHATISMSHEGLKGDGKLEYITSTALSKEFTFYPDSVNGMAQSYVIAEQKAGVEYPPVTSADVRLHWEPKRDHMYTYDEGAPFDIYTGQVKHHGGLDLHPKGLKGFGDLTFDASEMTSKGFNFKNTTFNADTADFRLKSLDATSLALKTSNVKLKIDLLKRMGEFDSNTSGTFVDFPFNKYICYIDKFKWDIDKKQITIVGDKPGSRFVSTHPQQDSLEWRSPNTLYDIASSIISAKDVDHIDVADAIIQPDSGKVIVRKDALMDPLPRANIIANRITKYHKFYDALVTVTGKRQYTANGMYDYVDITGKKQSIAFNSIRVDSAQQTYGEGMIPDDPGFTLSPNFDYKGKVKLFASRQHLRYAGSTRIKHNCPGITRDWLAFEEEIDPRSIYIPIPADPRDAGGRPLSSGVVMSKDSTQVYPTFLSLKRKAQDIDVVAAEGYLHYDNASGEYRISNKEKLKGAVVGGNYVSLDKDCIARGQGRLNLGLNFGQVKLAPLGTVKHNMNNDSTNFNLYFGMDFFFNEESQRIMADKLISHFPPLDAVYYGEDYEKALIELMGKEKTTKALQDLNLYGSFKKMPEELKFTIMLTDVKLSWDPKAGAYRYKGFIGVAQVGTFQVNKMMYGMIELKKKRGGDILNLYLEPSDNIWFFFTYQRGLMAAISSQDDFNMNIRETKPEKRTKKGSSADGAYQYILSTEIKKRNFIKSFEEE